MVACDGDFVQLLGSRHKSHFLTLKSGALFQTHRGELYHDHIIGQPWGSLITSHTGNPFYLMQPGLSDVISTIKRNSQIIYPKDIGYIIVTLGVGPGGKVLEAGTGSGALTTAFAFFVGSTGKVYSYDRREDMQNLAKNNLTRVGLNGHVQFTLADIANGFDERNVDSIFLDVPNPYDYILQVKESLKAGGYFGAIVPTTNQVNNTLHALRSNNFAFLEVCEILLRYYKPDWERLRPTDRMVAHTGYLLFGRSVIDTVDES